jgi:WD40 repeat protein
MDRGAEDSSRMLSEDVYTVKRDKKDYHFKSIMIKTRDEHGVFLSAADLNKLNSAYISSALCFSFTGKKEDEISKNPILDLLNITSKQFLLLSNFLKGRSRATFLKKLSTDELRSLFFILDFLQGDKDLIKAVIREDIDRKDEAEAWKDYDKTDSLYKDYVHNPLYKDIFSDQVLMKLRCSDFALRAARPIPVGFSSCVALADDNSFMVTCDKRTGSVSLHKLTDRYSTKSLFDLSEIDGRNVMSLKIAHDSSFIVATTPQDVRIWRLDEDHRFVDEQIIDDLFFPSIEIGHDNSFIAIQVCNGISLYRLNENHELIVESPTQLRATVRSLNLAHDDSFIVGGGYQKIKIWRLNEDHLPVDELPLELPACSWVESVEISHDNSLFIASGAGWAEILKIDEAFNLKDRKIVPLGNCDPYTRVACALARDDSFFVTSSGSRLFIEIWRLDKEHNFIGSPISLGLPDEVHRCASIQLGDKNQLMVTSSFHAIAGTHEVYIWRFLDGLDLDSYEIDALDVSQSLSYLQKSVSLSPRLCYLQSSDLYPVRKNLDGEDIGKEVPKKEGLISRGWQKIKKHKGLVGGIVAAGTIASGLNILWKK